MLRWVCYLSDHGGRTKIEGLGRHQQDQLASLRFSWTWRPNDTLPFTPRIAAWTICLVLFVAGDNSTDWDGVYCDPTEKRFISRNIFITELTWSIFLMSAPADVGKTETALIRLSSFWKVWTHDLGIKVVCLARGIVRHHINWNNQRPDQIGYKYFYWSQWKIHYNCRKC